MQENVVPVMPTDDSTGSGVLHALERVIGRPLPGLTEQASLFDDLDLDSTSVLEVLLAVEEECGVVIDPEDLDAGDLATVGSLTAFVRKQA